MQRRLKQLFFSLAVVILGAGAAQAFQFRLSDDFTGALDTTATAGFGLRLRNPSPSLVGDPNYSPDANTDQWSNGDDGNLNYRKWDAFSAYTKLTPELLLNLPERFTFMARGTFLYDFMAAETHRTPLAGSAKDQAMHDFRLLDLWLKKEFNIGNQTARVRVGNQVISWGESIFAMGGINQTNGLDIGKLVIPGTQLKEAVIPAPIVSFATGLGHNINMEAYYQFAWNRNRFPASGTFFSVADMFDNGRIPFLFLNPNNPNFGGLDQVNNPTFDPTISIPVPVLGDKEPKNSGQFGVTFHYKPEGTSLDLGAYFMNYHEKSPVLDYRLDGAQFAFLPDRQLYGLSANFPVGNWAVGMEASYRPKDAVALTGCFGQGGPLDVISNSPTVPVNCQGWIDQQKLQFILTGILALTPGSHGWFLNLVGADTGYITAEAVDIYYPTLKQRYNRTIEGQAVTQAPLAGYYSWKDSSTVATLGYPITGSAGTPNSLGYTVDFNVVYDGTVIPGWQVIPGVTWSHSVAGNTPTFLANYMEGAMSVNCYLLFNMNPATWQAGLNYANWFGGDQLRQPFGDREYIGGFVSYNF
jgi:hypothetical protein